MTLTDVDVPPQVDLGAELIHGDETSLYRLAKEKGWDMEELISLAQGDGGPIAADTNDGFGLFYLGGEKRLLAMNSKVRFGTVKRVRMYYYFTHLKTTPSQSLVSVVALSLIWFNIDYTDCPY